jgi:hypothetical protein
MGASVTATPASGQPTTATTNAQGAYDLNGLTPGTYDLKVSAPSFQDFERADLTITAGRAQGLDVPLLIQVEKQQVEVSDTAQTLDTSPEKNAGAMTVKGSDLDALSDDPDQLQQDLEALAGPATGPNGGQIYVNGFTAGQLPPKSSIREIRVNQNPFSAEYDQVGFGRIEILTKPGTDKLHGSGFVWSNDQPFNTWSPFVASNDRPGYYTLLFEGDVGGSLNKRTSFFFTINRRDITQLELGAALDPATLNVTPGAMGVSNPRVRTTVSPTIDYQVSTNNTLTTLYQYWDNNEHNDGISTYSLPSQGYNSTSYEHQLQVTDTQIFHEKIVNETRFQYLRDYAANTPLSTAYAFTAPGYVTGGGNTMGATVDTQNHYELQNYTTIAKGKHAIKFGVRLRDATEQNSSLATGNGAFTFASGDAYIAAEQALAQGNLVPSADYPIAFTLGTGARSISASLLDAGLFVQDDWQWRPNITLSTGLRFETQTGIPDHGDYAPRAAIAYGIGKTKAGAPRTVLRGGWGMFYNRFSESNLLNTLRFNGVNQVTYTVQNPTFFPVLPSSTQLSAFASLPTVDKIAVSLRAPYTMQAAATLEEQVAPGTTLTVNYINARGVHQFYTANVNTPIPGTFNAADPQAATYPFGYNAGYINDYESGGIFKQNELIVDFDGKAGKYLSLWGYYVLNDAHGTTGSLLSDYYNPSLDYGRVPFDIRNRVFVGGSINLKYGFEIDPYIMFISGQPFNITSGTNLFGTSATTQNARPSFTNLPPDPPTAVDPTHVQTVFATPWGNVYNGPPPAGESVIPINLGTGSSQFATNLSFGKTFRFGPKIEATPDPDAPPPPPSAGKTPGRYSLTLSAYSRNIFNHVILGQPVGVLGSPQFLQSVGLANGSASNRQIFLVCRFSF